MRRLFQVSEVLKEAICQKSVIASSRKIDVKKVVVQQAPYTPKKT